MDNTFTRSPDPIRVGPIVADGMPAGASDEIRTLIADVEELVARIGNLKDVDVSRVRSKVEQALTAAKQSLTNSTAQVRRQVRQAAQSADGYVRDNPWQSLGVAALVGAVMGFLAARRG